MHPLLILSFKLNRGCALTGPPASNARTSMANPKRKTSKRRSANRRAANAFRAPEFATDPTDGSLFRPHRVNPKTGMYRGRQVLDVQT